MDDLQADIQVEDKALTGAGPADGIEDFAANIENVFHEGSQVDPAQLAIDGAGMALDAVGFLTDPLGTLASSVVGWLIENVEWIREPFDNLMGDPAAIEAAANTWSNISKHLGDVAGQYKGSMTQIHEWQGQSGKAYRGHAAQLFDHVKNAETAASSVANKIKVAGCWVGATRALVRDLIAEFVGTLIAWGAAALASSWFTFGGSVAAFIARAVAKAVEVAGTIAQYLKKLFAAMDELGSLAKNAGNVLRKRTDDLAGMNDFVPPAPRQQSPKWDSVTNSMNTKAQNLRVTADRWDEQGGPLANTRLGRTVDQADARLSKGVLDGGNWARAMSGDLGQHRPNLQDLGNIKPNLAGDTIAAGKEAGKEYNKAFLQDERNEEKNIQSQKAHENKTREVRGGKDE